MNGLKVRSGIRNLNNLKSFSPEIPINYKGKRICLFLLVLKFVDNFFIF